MRKIFKTYKSFVVLILNYLNYLFLRICLIVKVKQRVTGKNLLIIETGGIGDLVVSSEILKNDYIFKDFDKVYFILRNEFRELFFDYSGNVKFININLNKFKYNLFYRLFFLNEIKKNKIESVFNITSARLIWNDIIALCSGAKKTYCFSSDWVHLPKLYGKKIDGLYSNIIRATQVNEYKKMDYLISNYFFNQPTNNIIFTYKVNVVNNNFHIIIAPFASSFSKIWKVQKFISLLNILSNEYRILVIGSSKDKNKMDVFRNISSNISFSSGDIKLNELYTAISNANVFIGLDSGITHLALMTHTQAIAIIGGGSYGRYFPKPNDGKTIYLAEKIECFGCEWECVKNNTECIDGIEVEEVYHYVVNFLME